MYSILIGLAITITVSTLIMRKWATKNAPSWLVLVLAVSCASIITASLVVPTVLGDQPPTVKQTTEVRSSIVAIKDNTLIEGRIGGSIFIVSGYLREEPVYFYYKREGGGYVQSHIKATGIVIYEDTKPGTGYISTATVTKMVDPAWKEKYLHWLVFSSHQNTRTTTEVHVPEGTIVQEFVLDAE